MALSSSQKSPEEKIRSIESSEEKIKSKKPGAVAVVDIDGTLALITSEEELQESPLLLQSCQIIEALFPHVLLRGSPELMKYFFAKLHEFTDEFRFCFFSKGDADRNDIFVRELLLKALDKKDETDKVDEIHNIDIISPDPEQEVSSKKNLKVSSKKNLKAAMNEADSLDSIILIDNDRGNILSCQTANGLITKDVTLSILKKSLGPTASEEDLECVNQLFYVAGILEEILENFSTSKESITEKLFKIQYKKTEKTYSLDMRLGLISYLTIEDFKLPRWQDYAECYDVPILIKIGEDQYHLLSSSNGKDWQLNLLDSIAINAEKFAKQFPPPNTHKIKPIHKGNYHLYRQDFDKLIKEINEKKYHVKFIYKFNSELYKDKERYRRGREVLRRYNPELKFFGYKADEYFGYQKKFSEEISLRKNRHLLFTTSPWTAEEKKNQLESHVEKSKRPTL